MREIKFRARRTKDGVWIYGSSNPKDRANVNTVPLSMFWAAVEAGTLDPETVGQYIGPNDKNGTEIYEGDFIKKFNSEVPKGSIEWHDGSFVARWIGGKNFQVLYQRLTRHYEIIGNIYENPELLEEKK